MAFKVNGEFNFQPREYQLPFLDAMDAAIKRAVLIMHRKAGKTILLLNWAIEQMLLHDGITIWHTFSTKSEAKDTIWLGKTKDHKSFISYFPKEAIKDINNTDFRITFNNGSSYVLKSTEEYDNLRGPGIDILINDEYSYQNDLAQEVLEPMVLAYKGIIIYTGTPNGRNHLFDVYNNHQFDKEKWFCQILTIDDTRDEYGNPLFENEDIEDMRKSGKSEAYLQAEYYCSFDKSVETAYYTQQLEKAKQDGRIGIFPHVPSSPVYTSFDIGYNDMTSIWFAQKWEGQFRIIDYYENRQQSFDHYAKVLKDKPYNYFQHYFPHDIANHEQTSGKTKKDYMESLGIKPIVVIERAKNRAEVMSGIDNVRTAIPKCYFNEKTCKEGLARLAGYHAGYNEKREVLLDSPVHDKNSNGADAFRMLAVSDFLENFNEPTETPFEMPSIKRNHQL